MARAFIRISVQPGYERSLKDYLLTQPEFESADLTTGEQDLIVVAGGPSFEAILKTVVDKVRMQEGVKSTWTNFILE